MSLFSKRDPNETLRQEVAGLGEMLGQTLDELAGRESFARVETIRRLARDHRSGNQAALQELTELIESLDEADLLVVIRAFTIFLDLANLAEDRQRIRVLRRREARAHPEPPVESVEAALRQLKNAGKTPAEIQSLLDRLHIELVFTAHPTEAKRRSIRAKLRRIRETLYTADHEPLPAELERNRELLRAELAKLWLTDFIRPWRPTVLQEVERGLSIKPVLWEVVPLLLGEVRAALDKVYPGETFHVGACVTLGSWIGGDRDGHPGVTTSVTMQTLLWLRQAALEFHLATCQALYESMSISNQQIALSGRIEEATAEAASRWPEAAPGLQKAPPNEFARRWLAIVQWRLRQTLKTSPQNDSPDGAYARPGDLEADVELLTDALNRAHIGPRAGREIQAWLDRIRSFGFHLARLDVRQDSRQYAAVVDELLQHSGLASDAGELAEDDRCRLLTETLETPLRFSREQLSDTTRETLDLFELLRQTVERFGPAALGGHVISMTHSVSDVLAVLWLWRQVHLASDGADEAVPALPIIPLLETIDDLQNGPAIFEALLAAPAYRDYLRQQRDRQTIMVGYSDSTKDGGYLAACWSLYRAQDELHALAKHAGVDITFFHGRGGSLGRGGGPAARGILSLPRQTFHGSIRLTEQGEVLADRYDDSRIAFRHLEQLLWSSLLAGGAPFDRVPSEWSALVQELAKKSLAAYRELVEQPGFVDYFRRATPIAEIEQLPIGSRPSRRKGGHGLKDLRAIPWVFSWTQSRCLAPAWYGMGAAIEPLLEQPASLDRLREMYRNWPFFRATIDNAELALAKTDLGIFQRYSELAQDTASLARIGELLTGEFARSKAVVLGITGNEALLDNTPWLKESIRVRNRYIDPLNLIQIELLRRQQAGGDSENEELRHLMRLTIKGLAAGMRTSG